MSNFQILIISLLITVAVKADIVSKPNPAGSAPPVTEPGQSPISETEKKKLIGEFQKEQANQRGAFAHQEKSAMKELNAAQSMKQKKWREDEKKARQQYFDQHLSGPERRDYVQAYVKRKEAFDLSLKNDYAAAKKSWSEKNAALKVKQKEQDEAFKAAIAKGIRPTPEFWQKNQ